MSRRPPEDRLAVISWHKQGLTPAAICHTTGFDRRFVTRGTPKYDDSGSQRCRACWATKGAFEECGADCGEENAEKKTPLESSDREGAQETEGR